MFYELPNGNTVEISTEVFFQLSDDEFDLFIQHLIGENKVASTPLNGYTSQDVPPQQPDAGFIDDDLLFYRDDI
jgi:hypothetical protein